MSEAEKLSKQDAERCLKLIEDESARWITPGHGPALVEDWEKTWDSPDPVIPWAIVWPDGPDDWAIAASHNEVIPRDIAFADPGTGFVLALYPA